MVGTDFKVTLQSTMKPTRSPSFGVGDRFKQRRHTLATPPPTTYTLKTCFEGESPTIKKNHLTTNFKHHSSRNDYGKQFVTGRGSPKSHHEKPGPGTYTYSNMTIGTDALKFTLKSRVKNLRGPEYMSKMHDIPGPGQYKTVGIDKEGKYAVSTIPNSKASVWSPPKSKRFKDELRHQTEKPEPGTYNPSDTHSMNDSFILSTMKNPGVKKIVQIKDTNQNHSNMPRFFSKRTSTPGPGTYVIPSEFGALQPNDDLRLKTSMISRCATPLSSTMGGSNLKLQRRMNMSEINVNPNSTMQRSRIQEFEKLRVTHNKSQQQAARPKFAQQREIDNFNDRVDSPKSPNACVKLNFDEVKLNID